MGLGASPLRDVKPQLTYRRGGHKLGGQHWADIPDAEFLGRSSCKMSNARG